MTLTGLLSAVTAALGAFLFFYGAYTERWLGLAVFITGTAALVLCICMARRQEKNIYRLRKQIIDFLEGRNDTPVFSVHDHLFALLENAVIELESRLLLERDNARKESSKNAGFITDVSHQLKTPLAALKLYCEMDNENNPGEHNQKQFALIERMEHLIYSLMRLEKLRADAYELQFDAHDLSALAGRVWEDLRPLYPKKNFSAAGKASIRCDAYWMGEALKNVLKNSCEHTAPQGRIKISLESADEFVTVTVEDNGGGIPQEELPKLFQRFYRSSRAVPDGGAGLGLAITRTIVEKHHGTIFAENTAQGLKITLCFPVLDGVLAIG